MSKKIDVDWGLCESNGVCMAVMPEAFRLEDDDTLTILSDEVTAENEEQVLDAIRQCPRQAISISD